MKIETLLTTGLTVAQAGELFGISKDKLNLKSCFVITIEAQYAFQGVSLLCVASLQVGQVGKLKAQDFTLKFAFTYYWQTCHLQTYYP